MLRSLFWVGYYSFLEAVRNRLLLGILLLMVPLLASSWMLDTYRLGFQAKIVKDMGLNAISVFGLLIVLFLSLDQIIPDIEKRSIYFVLTRHPDRFLYLIGRFLGIAFTLLVYHSVMAFFLLILLRINTSAWFWEILLGSMVVYLKQALLISIVLMLTTFLSKIVVISIASLIYVLGHCFDILRMLADKKSGAFIGRVVEFIAFFTPDFSLFELRLAVVHEIPIKAEALAMLGVYSLTAIAFFLGVGGIILSKRDL